MVFKRFNKRDTIEKDICFLRNVIYYAEIIVKVVIDMDVETSTL